MVKLHRVLILFILAMALMLTGCSSTATQESLGEFIDNSVITGKVKSRLFEDPLTKALEISVKSFKGVVQLSGFVGSKKEKDAAGKLAGSVEGVRRVENDIIVVGR